MAITSDMIIADVLRAYPETEMVFRKRLKGECSSCPGSDKEDISFGARMHNVSPEALVAELNAAVKDRKSRK
ncbi:MAG: DUF1858 domain-containing protein [Deltaproteobacteria bacterium]|nr:DUF1858 domain-containing protein [Deltaproteobacteria bacterium]